MGPSGKVLNGILAQVGLPRDEVYCTNVFNLRPRPSNDVKNLCGPKAEGVPGMPYLSPGKYVRAEYAPELTRLYAEIERVNPNVIVALGATPSWALLLSSGIKAFRGATAKSHPSLRLGRYYKVVPTYHPAAVMRDWRLRPFVLADLGKAIRESETPDLVRPRREIWIEPTLEDLHTFTAQYIHPSPTLSIDIETFANQVTCIGFAPSTSHAIVVPFVDMEKADRNYWPTFEEEREAWGWVRDICALDKQIVGQNFLYDMHFLYRSYGITVPHATHDTMLLHHALQPEMQKGLAFLGSVYTDERAWKDMRSRNDTLKLED